LGQQRAITVQPNSIQKQSSPTTSSPLESGDSIKFKGRNYVIYENEVRTGGSITWRNNNPGNITYAPEAVGYGAFSDKKNSIFAIFPDENKGFYAIISFLSARSGETIFQMMALYAPRGHGDNNPERYADSVAKQLGVPKTSKVGELSDEQLSTFANAIQQVEGWSAGIVLTRDARSDS
jgi:hypothetical protein